MKSALHIHPMVALATEMTVGKASSVVMEKKKGNTIMIKVVYEDAGLASLVLSLYSELPLPCKYFRPAFLILGDRKF